MTTRAPSDWSESDRDHYEERAALIEYLARLPRDRAEAEARAAIERDITAREVEEATRND